MQVKVMLQSLDIPGKILLFSSFWNDCFKFSIASAFEIEFGTSIK